MNTKTIKPTIAEIETAEEYEEFIEYVTNTEKSDTLGINRMKELMREHIQTERKSE